MCRCPAVSKSLLSGIARQCFCLSADATRIDIQRALHAPTGHRSHECLDSGGQATWLLAGFTFGGSVAVVVVVALLLVNALVSRSALRLCST